MAQSATIDSRGDRRGASPRWPGTIRSTQGIVVVSLLLVSLAALIFGLFEEANRRARMREAGERITSLAAILAEQAGRILDVANLAAGQATEVARGRDWDEVARSRAVFDELRQLQAGYEYINAIWLADAEGRARQTSRAFPAPAVSVADREHFKVQRERDAGPFLSELLRSRVAPEVNIVMSRRMTGADGGFAGVALVVLNPSYLLEAYREIRIDYPVSIEVVGFDRSILVRSPAASPEDALYQQRTTDPDLASAGPGYGRSVATDPRNGTVRMEAFHRIEGFPLYVVVGIEARAITQRWLTAMAGHALLACLALGAALLGLGVAHRYGAREERALAEVRSLKATLEDRVRERTGELERLFREENHRVKNSLQLAASLLQLQQAKTAARPVRQLLAEAHSRVLTIARLHEHLLQADNATRIDLKRYLSTICADIGVAIGQQGAVIACAIEPVTVPTELAVPLGLILNELVTNAVKHGLGGARGRIAVSLATRDGVGRLVVEDEGRGLPAGWSISASHGLGMQIVRGLADQIHARLHGGSTAKGARFEVEFPIA
ncbi:MAG: ATP-binding protein [Alphaproteobacteria bacterium]|nr:ATP-binding protein [Alphaproteobacteria bacterium]